MQRWLDGTNGVDTLKGKLGTLLPASLMVEARSLTKLADSLTWMNFGVVPDPPHPLYEKHYLATLRASYLGVRQVCLVRAADVRKVMQKKKKNKCSAQGDAKQMFAA